MKVVDAQEKDVDSIMELSEMFWKETGSPLKLNKEKVKDFVNYAIIDTNSTIRVCIIDDVVVGGCILTIAESMFSSDKVVQELGWFVHPDHRGIGKIIFDDASEWAKGKGTYLVFAMMNNKYEQVLTRLYEKNGFRKLETHYIKEI